MLKEKKKIYLCLILTLFDCRRFIPLSKPDHIIFTSMKKNFPLLLCLFVFLGCTVGPKETNLVPESISQLTDTLRARFAPDKRVALFEVNYQVTGKDLLVKGATTSPEARVALLQGLEAQGYRLTDSLQLLPDSVSLEGKSYGIVNLSVCNLRVEPDFSSEMTTQALMGMPVRLLQRRSWYRMQTPDNYIAWVHSQGVHPVTKTEYDAWNRAEKIIVTAHYGFAYSKPDVTSQTVSDVVSGDRLKWEGTEGAFYKVTYPDGRQAYIQRSISQPERTWRAALKQDPASIIRTAYTLMGVPYLWAGTSAKGMDCSGYVRTVLLLHDIIIPRDASQQAYVGQHIDIAPDFSNVQPGDLIFFGRKATPEKKERVVHVGIYVGDKKFIHSQGDVHVSSFDTADAEFDAFNLDRLLYAGRILPYINKEPALNTTLTNPYYRVDGVSVDR